MQLELSFMRTEHVNVQEKQYVARISSRWQPSGSC